MHTRELLHMAFSYLTWLSRTVKDAWFCERIHRRCRCKHNRWSKHQIHPTRQPKMISFSPSKNLKTFWLKLKGILKWTFWTKKVWATCNCRMTTRVDAFDRKLSGEHFHNLSYGHTTSRKVSTGLWSSGGAIWFVVRNPYQTI